MRLEGESGEWLTKEAGAHRVLVFACSAKGLDFELGTLKLADLKVTVMCGHGINRALGSKGPTGKRGDKLATSSRRGAEGAVQGGHREVFVSVVRKKTSW